MRFVNHRIIPLPRQKPRVSAKCLHESCDWVSPPSNDVAEVDRQCMSHTGLRPYHKMFRRSYEDVAIVQVVSQ
ncbi:hypothetical protein ABIC27_004809 [Streptomyces sp. PvR034]